MAESLVAKLHNLPPADCTVLAELTGKGGTLRVTQYEQYRWLQIVDDNLQSMVDINEPARPLSPTTVFMLMGLAFTTGRSRVLNLGLGGGAIERSLKQNYPDLVVDSVEFDARVIEAAKQYFFLPENHVVHEQKAEGYLSECTETFDLVLADLFFAGQSAACVSRPAFFRDIERCLSPEGVCVTNLLYSDQTGLVNTLKAARAHLPATWLLEVKGHQNVIAYFRRERTLSNDALKRNCMQELDRLGVDAGDWELVSLPNRV